MEKNHIEETFRDLMRNLLPRWFQMKNEEISFSQFVLLQILKKKGQKKVSELAELMTITPSAITGLSDKLVKNELVKRERSEEDRRIVRLVITEKGIKLAKEIEQEQNKKIEKIHENFSPEELVILNRMYEKLTGNLKNI